MNTYSCTGKQAKTLTPPNVAQVANTNKERKMFNFQHEVQDVNLIITSLEHKIRDMQLLIQKITSHANAQAQAQQAQPVTETVPVIEPTPVEKPTINN